MSKIQALKNYLEIDNNEVEIIQNGNNFETEDDEYCILTEEEVYELGEDLIIDYLEEILNEEVPEYLHDYFNKNKYVDDNISRSFEYIDYGYGWDEIEDDDENFYYCFKR